MQRDPTHNRGICPNAGPPLNPGGQVVIRRIARELASGRLDVGEHHTGTAKYIVFENHPLVKLHIILNLTAVADFYPIGHKYVLP